MFLPAIGEAKYESSSIPSQGTVIQGGNEDLGKWVLKGVQDRVCLWLRLFETKRLAWLRAGLWPVIGTRELSGCRRC